MVSTFEPGRVGSGTEGRSGDLHLPGGHFDGAYAKCDGGICFTSTEGKSFPGFDEPLKKDQIICSCPITLAKRARRARRKCRRGRGSGPSSRCRAWPRSGRRCGSRCRGCLAPGGGGSPRSAERRRYRRSCDCRERNNGSGCYPVLEAIEGLVDCVDQPQRPLLSSQGRPHPQVLRRRLCPILQHRGLTRTHHGRSRYLGQISRLMSSTTRRRAPMRRSDRSPRRLLLTTLSTPPRGIDRPLAPIGNGRFGVVPEQPG
jgi:hypothetical protein